MPVGIVACSLERSNTSSGKPCALYRCPDELLLQIFGLIDGDDQLTVTATSKRLRAIALDNSLWVNNCRRVFDICPEPGPSKDYARVDLAAWDVKSYFELYLGLRRWRQYLGWWVPNADNTTMPMRLAIDAHHGRLVCSWIDISVDFDDSHPLLQGTQLVRFHWGIHVLVGHIEAENNLPISVQNISYDSIEQMRFDWRTSVNQGSFSFIPPSLANKVYWKLFTPRRLDTVDKLFPSPSMYPAMRGASINRYGDPVFAEFYGRAPDALARRPNAYVPIHGPDSSAWSRSLHDPVDSGLYVASYGAHGAELLSVTFRTLTYHDFEWEDWEHSPSPPNLPWPWDVHLSADDPYPHLGPFSRNVYGVLTTAVGNILSTDLHPGQRIMEVTKLVGDSNVPRGQRSLIAFLDVPSERVTSADMLRRNEAIQALGDEPDDRLPAYAVLPPESKRPPVAPWPIFLDAENDPVLPARVMTNDEMMAPGAGCVVHGIGRVSDTGFRSPSWSPSIVHFASRWEFQVLWLGMVMTFTRLS